MFKSFFNHEKFSNVVKYFNLKKKREIFVRTVKLGNTILYTTNNRKQKQKYSIT